MAKTKHYVNNEDFLNALLEFRKKAATNKSENKPEPPIPDRKSTRLNSSHIPLSRMPSSA